ncbi:MAG TPA: 2-oxoacid:acceptor oxidoreductase family protein, partial [Spirochaetota bacterium]|nr:2-oxoacid:acceptor oxidoreductase family protein [Spirochaetota bacterium]
MQSSDLSIVLAGEAGQGIQLIESVITTLSVKAGYHVFATKEYMSRVRGGVNSTSLRISSRPVTSFVNRIDILIPLSLQGIRHLTSRMDNHTVIIADDSITDEREIIHVSFNSIAREIGNQIYSNTVAAGLITALLSIDPAMTEDFIGSIFDKKGDAIRNNNILAVRRGYDMAKKIAITVPQIGKGNESDRITLSGADAVALGALAGGCDYVCGYPMSPSTGVLERMAKYSLSHDIIVEQVEDEIGVVNMALGAWYAGGRALVTTSGGGFALMCEGISLAGMIETPLVIHLAQRPGPATGLPTRTE